MRLVVEMLCLLPVVYGELPLQGMQALVAATDFLVSSRVDLRVTLFRE